MCQFIETIRVENHRFQHLEDHIRRLEQTWLYHYGHLSQDRSKLDALIDSLIIPDQLGAEVYKARLVYGLSIDSLTFTPYTPKLVRTLMPVVADALDYRFKYTDRSALDTCLANRGGADDVLLIKNGFVTDTSFSNVIVLKDATWLTPSTYLLNGTCRQRLIRQGLVREATIRLEDLSDCQEIRLINAMLDPWTQPAVTVLTPFF